MCAAIGFGGNSTVTRAAHAAQPGRKARMLGGLTPCRSPGSRHPGLLDVGRNSETDQPCVIATDNDFEVIRGVCDRIAS